MKTTSHKLKRVNLMLDEALVASLRDAARKQRISMSGLVRKLLARDLGLDAYESGATERIRRLREQLGPMPESSGVIREARERGW